MLLCNACSLAKAIGLHRTHHESSYPSEIKFSSADLAERRYVFWTLYIMDKSLSLTFGRPSSLPDFDIDVELPDFDPENPLWDLYIAWIESAKVQSEIQVKLYSASALKLHTEEKRRNVIDLDGKWRGWWMRYSSLLGRRSREEAFERKYVMTELMFCYHNTMIMIHRVNTQKNDGGKSGDNPQVSGSGVVRGSPMESEMLCLEHARKGINMIRDTISQKSSLARSGLMMW